jgi:hypothetical protein
MLNLATFIKPSESSNCVHSYTLISPWSLVQIQPLPLFWFLGSESVLLTCSITDYTIQFGPWQNGANMKTINRIALILVCLVSLVVLVTGCWQTDSQIGPEPQHTPGPQQTPGPQHTPGPQGPVGPLPTGC